MRNLDDLMRRALAPDRRLSVVEWAEQNIFLSQRVSPDFPGFYRSNLTPYAREPLEWFTDPTVSSGTMCWATQTSKSLTLIIGAAYKMACRPTNIVWGGPTIDFCRKFSQTKLQPVFRDCPGLRAEMPTDPDQFKILEMHLARASLIFAWSNSPQSLAGTSASTVIGDEIDKWGRARDDEADPVMLLDERTKGSPRSLKIYASTPTTEDGAIWRKFLESDQCLFEFPSPHTGDPMTFEFSDTSLVWSPEAKDQTGRWNLDHVRRTAHYVCPHSGKPITDSMKLHVIRRGAWRPRNTHAQTGHRGTRLPSFYSPTVTFGDMAVEFLRSKNDFFGLQNFYNSWLALPWKNLASTTDEADILKHRAGYARGTFPVPAAAIILGVDVGQSYVRWAAGAFTDSGELFLIDWGTEPSPGALPDLVRKARFRCTADNTEHGITLGWVDAKYRKDEVHKVCYHSGGLLWPAAGTGGVYSARGVWTGPVSPYPAPYALTSFNDRDFKTKLYIDRLKKGRFPGIKFPQNIDELLVRELTSEELRENADAHASRRYEWKRTGDNHLGDAVKLLLVGWDYLQLGAGAEPAQAPNPGDVTYTIRDS